MLAVKWYDDVGCLLLFNPINYNWNTIKAVSSRNNKSNAHSDWNLMKFASMFCQIEEKKEEEKNC